MKVFIIDRYARSGKALQTLLQDMREGWTVCGQSYSGTGGQEQVAKLQPDVILLEPLIYGVDSRKIIQGIKSLREVCSQAKVMAISASSYREHIRSAMRAGVVDYLYKPVTTDELLSALEQCTGSRGSAQRRPGKGEIDHLIVQLIQKGDSATAAKALTRAIQTEYQELGYYNRCVRYMEIATMAIHLPDSIDSVPEQLAVLYQSFIKFSSRNQDLQALDREMFRFTEQCAEAFNQFSGDSGYHRIQEAMQFVEDHLGEELSLKRLSGALYLSPTYFSRLFKEKAGQQFSEYLVDRRIERAKLLLTTSDLAVADVARQVGYTEANSFSRVFKAKTGKSPLQFRKQKI